MINHAPRVHSHNVGFELCPRTKYYACFCSLYTMLGASNLIGSTIISLSLARYMWKYNTINTISGGSKYKQVDIATMSATYDIWEHFIDGKGLNYTCKL